MLIIGITGHRHLEKSDEILSRVDQALGRLKRAYSGEQLKILSALAEGADRLVARRALDELGATLVVPLPLSPEAYESDFVSQASKEEFRALLQEAEEVIEMSPSPTRRHAYAFSGRYIVENAQVLIAVWDGEEARGKGGTGEIVALARAKGMPLVWISANNTGKNPAMESAQEVQNVVFERFPQGSLEWEAPSTGGK
jgi:hypothetical protein